MFLTKNIGIRTILLCNCLATLVLSQTDSDGLMPQGDCKSMLRGFIDGQLSSALGSFQIENLRKEFEKVTSLQEAAIVQLKRELSDLKNDKGRTLNISVLYTRWGKTTCPAHADLVYSGFVGGSHYTHKGAASEPVCLPPDPEWGIHTDTPDGSKAFMYGAEYEVNTLTDSRKNVHNYNVPCAVCRVHQRSISTMIPGRKTCYSGWNLEYTGYLMAGYHGHEAASQYTCIDESPDALQGTQSNDNGYLFNAVEGVCGSLPCPPYANGRELTCVVCST